MFKVFYLLVIIAHLALSQHDYYNDVLEESSENLHWLEELPELPVRRNVKNKTKFCRYRELLYPEQLWLWQTGGGCYFYTNPERFTEGLPMRYHYIEVENKNYTIIVARVDNITFPFDYTNDRYMEFVKPSFKTKRYFEKFIDCCQSAIPCCNEFMNEANIYPSDEFPCPATWDAWRCFAPAKTGTTSSLPCPDYAISADETPCTRYAERYCLSNSTWNQQTNYLPCTAAEVFKARNGFHLDILIASTVLILPAVVILVAFEKLRFLRLALHRNLIISIAVKNIFTITLKSVVIMDALKPNPESNNVLLEDGVGCKILTVLENFSKNIIFTCMLVDGFYLHKMIVRAFHADPRIKIIYAVVFVFSALPTLIWSILMAAHDKGDCWIVDTETWFPWITDGYKYLILIANILMLFDIIRVLVFKFGKLGEMKHAKETFKAAVLIIPLFGIPLGINSVQYAIDMNDCSAGNTFYYVYYSVEGLQALMVAVIFCYLNSDVHSVLRNAYRKWNINIRQRYGFKMNLKNSLQRTDLSNLSQSNDPKY